MTRTLALERMVWRHEYGHLSSSALEAGFSAELGQIDDTFAAVQHRLSVVRRHDASLLRSFDDCRSASGHAFDGGRWPTCLHQITRAAQHLTDVTHLLAAHDEIAAVDADATVLRQLVREVGPYRLTSIETPTALVAAAKECMDEHTYLKARSLAAFAAAYLMPLMVRAIPPPEMLRTFTDRIRHLTEICNKATRAMAAGAELAPGPIQDAMRNGWVNLSVRLLGELEIQAASRAQLSSALLLLAETDVVSHTPQITKLAGERSFEAAASYVRHLTIDRVTNRTTQLNVEIKSLIGAWNGQSDAV